LGVSGLLDYADAESLAMCAYVLLYDTSLKRHGLTQVAQSGFVKHADDWQTFCQHLDRASAVVIHLSDDYRVASKCDGQTCCGVPEDGACRRAALDKVKPLVVFSGGGIADAARLLLTIRGQYPNANVACYSTREVRQRLENLVSRASFSIEPLFDEGGIEITLEVLTTLWSAGLSWEAGGQKPTAQSLLSSQTASGRANLRLCDLVEKAKAFERPGDRIWNGKLFGDIVNAECPTGYYKALERLRDVLLGWAKRSGE